MSKFDFHRKHEYVNQYESKERKGLDAETSEYIVMYVNLDEELLDELDNYNLTLEYTLEEYYPGEVNDIISGTKEDHLAFMNDNLEDIDDYEIEQYFAQRIKNRDELQEKIREWESADEEE